MDEAVREGVWLHSEAWDRADTKLPALSALSSLVAAGMSARDTWAAGLEGETKGTCTP